MRYPSRTKLKGAVSVKNDTLQRMGQEQAAGVGGLPSPGL